MRLPQISELMRSESSQSGPDSSSTTFLPALASTDAYTEPEAPAPTMTTSTFSLLISPPLLGWNMRHVGNAERLITFHRSVDDVDRIGAKHGVDQRARPPGPAFDLVLPHQVDEAALIGRRELCEVAPVQLVAAGIDGHDRGAIEIRKRRTEIEDARLQQRLGRRHRELLIDEMGNAGL